MTNLSPFNRPTNNDALQNNVNSGNIHVDEESSFDIYHYLRMVRRRKWEIILTTIAFIALGIIFALNTTPIYSASSKIKADPVQPNATASDQYIMNSMVFLFYETQYEIIQSRKVAETVVEKLDLLEKYKEAQRLAKLESDNESIINELKTSIKSVIGTEEATKPPSDAELKQILADNIRNQIKVDGGTQSQIINISFESEDPQYAADIVNAVSDAYVAFGLETRLEHIEETSEWLSQQLAELKQRVQDSETKLREFSEKSGLVDTSQQQRIAGAQLTSLNTELIKAQTRLSETEELYLQVRNLKTDDYSSLGPVLQSNSVRDLVKEESRLTSNVKELSERYGEKHPKMVSARSELAALQISLDREIAKIVDNIGKEYRLAQTQVTNIEKLIKDTKEQVQSYQGDSFELTRLEREVENNRMVYENFLSRLMETDISGNYDGSNISIIDRAVVPSYPIKPRIALIIIASILAGGFVGLAVAFIRETLTNTFITPDHIEEKLNLPSIGITPLVKRNKKTPAAEKQYIEDSRTTFAEAINTIRTGLLFSNISTPPQSILITSSAGSEGKTTLAINLAVAFSQLDKTLLLELDLRKPTVKKKLNLDNDMGLVDIIAGKTGETSIFSKVENVPNLNVLTCGTIPPNPAEIISSRRFQALLESLKERYTYIIIDSPPTLPVSDSCMLSKVVDCTLVAVRAEETKIKSAKETIGRLKRVGANITGIVLTQASQAKMSYYGEHYYQESYYGVELSKK